MEQFVKENQPLNMGVSSSSGRAPEELSFLYFYFSLETDEYSNFDAETISI